MSLTWESDTLKPIAKDEIWNWNTLDENTEIRFIEAFIPQALYEKLKQHLSNYRGVCKEINDFIENHPEFQPEE